MALGLLELKVGRVHAATAHLQQSLVPGNSDPAPHNGLATIAANRGKCDNFITSVSSILTGRRSNRVEIGSRSDDPRTQIAR